MEVTSGYIIYNTYHINYFLYVREAMSTVKLIHVYQNGRPFCGFCNKSLVIYVFVDFIVNVRFKNK